MPVYAMHNAVHLYTCTKKLQWDFWLLRECGCVLRLFLLQILGTDFVQLNQNDFCFSIYIFCQILGLHSNVFIAILRLQIEFYKTTDFEFSCVPQSWWTEEKSIFIQTLETQYFGMFNEIFRIINGIISVPE